MNPHASNAIHYDFIFSNRFGAAYNQLTQNNLKKIESLININSKIVDFGAGTGRLTIPLAQKGYSISAVDSSKEMLAVLTQKANALNLNIPIYSNLLDVNCDDERFDLIISVFTVLSYITNQNELNFAVKNMWDLLKDDGLVLLDLESIFPYIELSNRHKGLISSQQKPDFTDKVKMEFSKTNLTLCTYSEHSKGINTLLNVHFDCKEKFPIKFWTIDEVNSDRLFTVIDSFQIFNATYYILKKNS